MAGTVCAGGGTNTVAPDDLHFAVTGSDCFGPCGRPQVVITQVCGPCEQLGRGQVVVPRLSVSAPPASAVLASVSLKRYQLPSSARVRQDVACKDADRSCVAVMKWCTPSC